MLAAVTKAFRVEVKIAGGLTIKSNPAFPPNAHLLFSGWAVRMREKIKQKNKKENFISAVVGVSCKIMKNCYCQMIDEKKESLNRSNHSAHFPTTRKFSLSNRPDLNSEKTISI